jgi:hypothetical protein
MGGSMTIVYKLVKKRKDGSIGPLFINARQRIPIGEWLPAEAHERKGFAFRPGWHCTFTPEAPHLSEKGRVWMKCEVKDYVTYPRPESQGGSWVLANQIRFIEEIS